MTKEIFLMNSGLSSRDIQAIWNIFNQYPEITLVYLFGSRAKGTQQSGSDIDMAIMDKNIPKEILTRLKGAFEESELPYLVDLVHYHGLDHQALKDHIDRVGIEIYRK